MTKDVIKIEPIIFQSKKDRKSKIAAYCRVSSKQREVSFESQTEYYTNLIKRTPYWELVNIYADKGLSGTRTDNREGFQQMMNDCRNGKIDIIITKSLSRFARNTYELISLVRELKSLNISIHFENEKIDTMSMNDEILLTVLSAVAQTEAESISDNIKWGIKKRFMDGSFLPCLPYGYVYDKNKNIVIVDNEAEIVRFIYTKYLNGTGSSNIVRELNSLNIASAKKRLWDESRILYILRNSTYIGDMLLQKSYTTESLPKKRRTNDGERPQYLVSGGHVPIISKEEYERVQKLLGETDNNKRKSTYTFSNKIRCGICGGIISREKGRSGKVLWMCKNYLLSRNRYCSNNSHINEDVLKNAFINMHNKLLYNKRLLVNHIERLEWSIEKSIDKNKIAEIDKKLSDLSKKESLLNEAIINGYIESSAYITEKNIIGAQVKERLNERKTFLKDTEHNKKTEETKVLIKCLNSGELMIEFDDNIFRNIVEYMVLTPLEVDIHLKNELNFKEKLDKW